MHEPGEYIEKVRDEVYRITKMRKPNNGKRESLSQTEFLSNRTRYEVPLGTMTRFGKKVFEVDQGSMLKCLRSQTVEKLSFPQPPVRYSEHPIVRLVDYVKSEPSARNSAPNGVRHGPTRNRGHSFGPQHSSAR